jgi:hypothetical protein
MKGCFDRAEKAQEALALLREPCGTCLCMDCGKVIKVTEQSKHLKECPKEKTDCQEPLRKALIGWLNWCYYLPEEWKPKPMIEETKKALGGIEPAEKPQSELTKAFIDFLKNDPLNHHKEWLERSYEICKALDAAEARLHKDRLKLLGRIGELTLENKQLEAKLKQQADIASGLEKFLAKATQEIKHLEQVNSSSAEIVKQQAEQIERLKNACKPLITFAHQDLPTGLALPEEWLFELKGCTSLIEQALKE